MKEQIIEFLERSQKPAKTLGLYRMKELMGILGDPQDKLQIIHVAGTNGKGSVSAMTNSILMEAGYKVGLFTSPHLIEVNERIQINRSPINNEDFIKIALEVKEACRKMSDQGQETPIFFEILTAIGFIYFQRQNVDIVILETGIGGKYDATNIIKKPLLSVITSIGKDHTEYLGNTIEEISREKGGIIKENCPTVLYNSGKSVYNVIERICQKNNSKLFFSKETVINNEEYTLQGSRFNVKNEYFTYKDISLQLLGKYQISNAITSLMIVECINDLGFNIISENVYGGLKAANWPGRMEVVEESPTIIIDGAHNKESAKAFIESLLTLNKNAKIHMLVGVIEGKDYKSILEILLPHAYKVTLTQSKHSKSVPAKKLHKEINIMQEKPILHIEEDPVKAYQKCKDELDEKEILCCLGSLYLIGELKEYLEKEEVNND